VEIRPQAAADPKGSILAVASDDGIVLRVQAWSADDGNGRRPFVLLHGIASNARTWDGVARRLAAAGCTAYAVDFRGHGISDRPATGYDLETYAADLTAAVSGLGLERPIIVGHSLGANVILEALAMRSDFAGGVAFVEGGLVSANRQFATLEECQTRLALPPVQGLPLKHLRAFLAQSHPAWPEWRLAATVASFDVLADGTVAYRLTAGRFEALLRALWMHDVAAAWPRIRVPALVLAADTGDLAWTAAKHEAAADLRAVLPDARVDWLTSDHDVHADRPSEVADLLVDAFAGH
jgi:pimeloyl-ACP methyl ester carboxylesterase